MKAWVVRVIPGRLLNFSVQRVLALVTAELLQLEFLRRRFPVLGRRVIPTLALGALERNDFSSCACHFDLRDFLRWLEPSTRFELVTPSLPRTCSTPELRGQFVRQRTGAGDGIRTRDQQLGRL